MLDIDFFKKFNDTYGHKIGDEVLHIVGTTLKECIKGKDLAARYGGEEFAVLLPSTTLANALTLAEQIRLEVAGKTLKLAKRPGKGSATSAAATAYRRYKVGILRTRLLNGLTRPFILPSIQAEITSKRKENLPIP